MKGALYHNLVLRFEMEMKAIKTNNQDIPSHITCKYNYVYQHRVSNRITIHRKKSIILCTKMGTKDESGFENLALISVMAGLPSFS